MDSTFTTFDVFVFLAGAVWLLKKVTEGDRYHDLGVIVLTVILSCVAIYCFNCVYLEAGNPEFGGDECKLEEGFTCSEI